MTLPNSWVLFYIHEKEELYDQERLQQFFTRLSERKCAVSLVSETASLAIWRKYLVNVPTTENTKHRQEPFAEVLQPHVSQGLRKQVLTYVRERQSQLAVAVRSINRSPLARGFELTVMLVPTEGYILLSVEQERFFKPTLDGLAKYRYWIRVLEETYACWQPIYAHEFTHQGPPSVNPSWEEVRTLHIPALYDLNMYGPELVQHIGSERLLHSPAWLVKELEGSGCLLIPTDIYGLTSEKAHDFEAIAQYLGFPTGNHAVPDSQSAASPNKPEASSGSTFRITGG